VQFWFSRLRFADIYIVKENWVIHSAPYDLLDIPGIGWGADVCAALMPLFTKWLSCYCI
jgi:hypothetical protein